MLTGKPLGAAIEAARIAKKVSKKELADAFGVKPPSIQDWVNRGTIGKEKLPLLWDYFSNVVGPEHWGLKSYPTTPFAGGSAAHPVQPDAPGVVANAPVAISSYRARKKSALSSALLLRIEHLNAGQLASLQTVMTAFLDEIAPLTAPALNKQP